MFLNRGRPNTRSDAIDAPARKVTHSAPHALATTPPRSAPTGSTVAVFVFSDPIVQTPDDGEGEPLVASRGLLVGPHDRPAVNEPTGETFAVGIVTTPVGCEAVFGVAPSSIRRRIADLELAWHTATVARRELASVAANPEAMLDVLNRRLDALCSGRATSESGTM